MATLVQRAAQVMRLALAHTSVRIIDHREPAVIGHSGEVVDVEWAPGLVCPVVTVDCRVCDAQHHAEVRDLEVLRLPK